jgi:YceI-like domain
MSLTTGKHTLGPQEARLTIRTGKGGAAARAAHNLVIEVTSWNATLDVGEATTLALSADSRSLRVLDGSGGAFPLGDSDKESISKTIHDEVLKGGTIEFHSTAVTASDDGRLLNVQGQLELLGKHAPVTFELKVDDAGAISGEAVLKQSDWNIKPYSTLFGTLKVADELRVAIEGKVPVS